jgi:hypothetical protein
MMTVICDHHLCIVHATEVDPALHDAQMAIYHVIIRIFRGKMEPWHT